MEQQQGANWTLEDIKGAFLDDMKAMMQEELRQPLARLIPPPEPADSIPPAVVIPSVAANPPIVNTPPANNDNAGGEATVPQTVCFIRKF